MKELLKDRNVWILLAIAFVIGAIVTYMISASKFKKEEESIKQSLQQFLANNPTATGSELLGVYNVAITHE